MRLLIFKLPQWWLVQWPLIGALLHLVQRGGDWAGCGPAQSRPRCTNATAHQSTASVPTSYYSMWHFKGLSYTTKAGVKQGSRHWTSAADEDGVHDFVINESTHGTGSWATWISSTSTSLMMPRRVAATSVSQLNSLKAAEFTDVNIRDDNARGLMGILTVRQRDALPCIRFDRNPQTLVHRFLFEMFHNGWRSLGSYRVTSWPRTTQSEMRRWSVKLEMDWRFAAFAKTRTNL